MDARIKKPLSLGGRETRASEDASRAPVEEKFMSAQERRKMWSDEWTQTALPKVPPLPGWHLCWLSTTNSYDSIDKRMRLGYVPVTADEFPGFENYRVKAGEQIGHIAMQLPTAYLFCFSRQILLQIASLIRYCNN
jgi:hypothetical protein